MNLRPLALALTLVTISLTGCMSPKGSTVAEQRANGLKMRDEAVKLLVERDSDISAAMEKAPGYAVWSAASVHPGICAFAFGYMVVTDNKTKEVCYRKFLRFGVGPGIAIKGFYGIAVLRDEKLVHKFMTESSFNFGIDAEASFVFGSFGGSATATDAFNKKIDIDIKTHTGVALEAFMAGAWTWPNKELNEKSEAKPKP